MGPKASSIPFVLLDVDISNTAPDTHRRDIRFRTKEGLMGGLSRYSSGGGPIPDMDESSQGLTPERQRKASLVKHGDDALLHGPVGSLSHTILLRPGPDRMLPLDPMVYTEVIELLSHVLTPLVLPEDFDGLASLILSPSLEPFETGKCL